MSFEIRAGVLHAESVPLPFIGENVGTPAYVYSSAAIRQNARRFLAAFRAVPGASIAYAVKANSSLAVLRLLADEGLGADIVSAGELLRATAAGISPSRTVFSGVGKSRAELAAALDAGVGQINLELEEEGYALAALARARGVHATAALRVNPDVDAGTHAKITTGRRGNKFGVAIEDAPAMYARLAALDGLDLTGIAVHIGSQLLELAPLEAAYARIGDLLRTLRAAGHLITRIDLGGGLGVTHRFGERAPAIEDWAALVAKATRGWDVAITVEPGRAMVADAGVLLTEVIWVKPTSGGPCVIVDAGMNDLARPALYGAWHEFAAVRPTGRRMVASIAGPVCESGDTFATARTIDRVEGGDLGVLLTAGAYGASMASTYNCRPMAPEVLVDGARFAVVSERITPAMMLGHQRLAPWMAAGAPLASAA